MIFNVIAFAWEGEKYSYLFGGTMGPVRDSVAPDEHSINVE